MGTTEQTPSADVTGAGAPAGAPPPQSPAVTPTTATGLVVGAIPPAAAATATAAVLAGLGAFLGESDKHSRAWLAQQLRRRTSNANDVQRAIAQERALAAVFAQRQQDRVRADMRAALRIADPKQRDAVIRAILAREERHALQHAEAMAVRAFAAITRYELKRTSPQGALWLLGPADEHTPDCVAMAGMAGRFWPWAVLDHYHPPLHTGCACRLRGYRDAVQAGLMKPSDVPDVRAALGLAAKALAEVDEETAAECERHAEELELREALVAAGLTTRERLAALVDGG